MKLTYPGKSVPNVAEGSLFHPFISSLLPPLIDRLGDNTTNPIVDDVNVKQKVTLGPKQGLYFDIKTRGTTWIH